MQRTSENTTGYRTFQATAVALAVNIRVAVDSNGTISVAGVGDMGIGITTEAIAASGYGTVKLWSGTGTFQVTASAAITCGAVLYPTAAGKFDDAVASGAIPAGLYALEAATADGDIIEVAAGQGGGLPLGDGSNIVLGTTTGTKLGTSASQKLGFYNATAVVQPSSASQAAVSTTVGSAVAGTGSTQSSPYGYTTAAQADAIVTNVNALRVDVLALETLVNQLRSELVTLGLIKGSA